VRFGQLLDGARAENVLNSVLLELTYGCNLDCTFCYNDLNLRGQRVSLNLYRELLDELAMMNVMSLILSGGEPLLYPNFFQLGAYAREKGFLINVKSNGLPLNQRNARRLRQEVDPFIVELSLHGATAPTHDRLTRVPGSFERLLRNIRILQDEGLRIKLNSTLTCWNEGEVAEMFALADELEAPLQFDPEVTPRDDGDLSPLAISPSTEGIGRMMRLSMERARSAQLQADPGIVPAAAPKPACGAGCGKPKACGAGSTNLIIDPFGNVYPCVQFRRKVGNIHDDRVGAIWQQSVELLVVRNLAEQAAEVARDKGMRHFCMGLNELITGDALKAPESKIKINKLFKRISWEVYKEDDQAA
jgi:radical SAM protein with 4Fe4S-binding SPASM domain